MTDRATLAALEEPDVDERCRPSPLLTAADEDFLRRSCEPEPEPEPEPEAEPDEAVLLDREPTRGEVGSSEVDAEKRGEQHSFLT